MKYIIVTLIRGEAKVAHEAITADLAQKFDVFPMHERIPPHLSIKRWFEIDKQGMLAIYKKIEDFTASHKQSDYELKGFNHFGTDVVYMDVKPSKETLSSVHDLMVSLREVEGLTFDEFDDIEDDLHATVVMGALKPFDYEKVWNYLQTTSQPDFKMKFDNIALMKRTADKWEVDHVWEIKACS